MKHRPPILFLYLAWFTCGAFRTARSREGAKAAGEAARAICCSHGKHSFEVHAYRRMVPPGQRVGAAFLRVMKGGKG